MKKTSKSPVNVEVTPNKKKLKQARLPFMLLSDVSPKTETPPSRKRKLSVPDVAPATKVGKLSKENSLTEELVVISDEDSKGLPSPKKQEKIPNPYVKLVDAAWKKKLHKAKGQKNARTKSTKKQTNVTSEDQAKRDSSGNNNDVDDVEMMEIEVVVHHNDNKDDGEKSEKSISTVQNANIVDQKHTIKHFSDRKKSPKKTSLKQSPKIKQSNNSENSNKIKPIDINETICLDESNNSADVNMSKSTIKEKVPILPDNGVDAKDEIATPDQTDPEKSSAIIKRPSKKKLQSKEKTPKKSSIIKVTEKNSEKSDVSSNEEESDNSSEREETQLEQENNSDAEMVELETHSKEKSPQNENDSSISKSEEPVTPKRSLRNITKNTEINLDVSTCSILNESLSSNLSSPKQDKSLNESLKNLTPKQMAKRLEAAKRREEREKEKHEREKKRQQEKEERVKQRQEKEDQKKREREEKEEAKKKEREEKEEQKRKEREEKEKQKELEKKVREEKEEAKRKEKEEKEEQRKKEKEAREEERRKKQEALELEKQEQELKLKKTKEAFVSFFVPKQKVEKEFSSVKAPVSKNRMLSSFTVKVDMRLAPTCRVELDVNRKDALEKFMNDQDGSGDYLKSLRDGTAKPGSSGKTWPLDEKDDDDVMIVEDELPPLDVAGAALACEPAPRERLRPKLLSFHENRRPPYWGTWRKQSAFVKPRRPFGQEKQLDYEVDSDDDWEDEADGESLDGSAGGSDDEAGNDDYEVDNEVFVPHGYLSDEEATMDEEDDNVLSLSPETQKVRLKHLEDEFESELKKPTEKLKPRLYGPLWENSEGQKPENCIDALWNYFQKFAMIMDDVTPFLQPAPEPEKETEKKKIKKKKVVAEGEINEQSPKSKKKKESKAENKEGKKLKQEAKKSLPNQPGINTFLKKVNTTQDQGITDCNGKPE